MKRLTEHNFEKTDNFHMKCSDHCCIEDFSCEDCKQFDDLVDRLGAIEDILGDDYDLDRLRELVEANLDGRCMVLPLKPGDEVYYIGWSVCSQGWDDPEECSGCGYDECDSKRVVQSMVIHSYSWIVENFIERENNYYYKTYEGAEAALKNEWGEKEHETVDT